jgi:enoyl-CoA hydratase/carnithine racemase
VQRLRFEHPGVKVVVMRSGKNRVFCAGANIRMLAGATHAPQGQFLQIHQRDPQRPGRFFRKFRATFHHRRQRHGGRRRL